MTKEMDTMVTFVCDEAKPHGLGQGRRVGVAILATIVAVVACGVIGTAFAQSSWWHPYPTDYALDQESFARIEAIRDRAEASGLAPKAVTWLTAALESRTLPTDVRGYLLSAQERLVAVGDPGLAEDARELRAIAEKIRPTTTETLPSRATPTPYTAPTVEWP
jgi:hypothetical protein